MSTTLPDDLEPLPPAAKLVYKTLQYEGPLAQPEIYEHTLLPRITIRDALGRLEEADLITFQYQRDARRKVYKINK